jgi:hypothetical protein
MPNDSRHDHRRNGRQDGEEVMKSYHSIERTSPKGEGSPFIGYCVKCGKQGLRADAALEECEVKTNPNQDLIDAIEGPK